MTVQDVKDRMPTAELMGWVEFYGEKRRKEEVSKGNLLAMDENQIIGAFGG